MSFFDKVYTKVFGKPENTKTQILHETLTRDSKYTFYYEEWKSSTSCFDTLKLIANSYQKKLIKEDADPKVHVLLSPYSNGLAISFDQTIRVVEFEYLLDYFKDTVLDHFEYKLEISDRQVNEKNNVIETKQKHYLKPIRPKQNMSIPQLFGNIIIEHITIDEKPSYLKIQANTYNDQLFEKPYKFEGLLETLLNIQS